MIIGDKREEVIENIQKALVSGEYCAKVEVNDPVLSREESDAIIDRYILSSDTLSFKVKSFVARKIANVFTKALNKDTEIIGLENLEGVEGGAVITSNHFGPLDNTAIRYLFHHKLGMKRVNIVSQETNLAMPGVIGFLMNYADIIPISGNKKYLGGKFLEKIQSLVDKGEYVLIYPEQEMWFNYRKPRPVKRGAYYYAAKMGTPIISCFVEMVDKDEIDRDNFRKVQYKVHVLPAIYPDPSLSVRDNSARMCEIDYMQKKAAYEKAYKKELTYDFYCDDIAGYIPQDKESA